ncbi:prolyl aminopeptidase-2, partial [Xylogone sp. PMI_703]
MAKNVKEGTVTFDVPSAGKPCETWYKVHGDLSAGKTPLVVVHGGPGLSHDYMNPLAEVASKTGIPVILYDQIGNGRSTHIPEKAGDAAFWCEQLFHDELTNLVQKLGVGDSYFFLGHSWGGMMGATFAAKRPKGLKKLVLSNAPSSTKSWCGAYVEYKKLLPKEKQDIIDKNIAAGTWEDPEYEEVMGEFFSKYMCTVDPWPSELLTSFEWAKKDSTVGMTMLGPNEFDIQGSLADWNAVDVAKDINVPTLVINGVNEGASDASIRPFLDDIPGVKYIQFKKSAHCPFYEEPEEYLRVVCEFL